MSKGISTVFWSGGADSTLALLQECKNTSEARPIQALTLAGHPQLNAKHLASERKARRRFLKWARRRGYHINHVEVTVAHQSNPSSAWGGFQGSMPVLWLSYLAPYMAQAESRAVFGYIARDVFWQWYYLWLPALQAIATLCEATWHLQFPLQQHEKWQVLRDLEAAGVPNKAWWTCDQPTEVGHLCGRCAKCDEVRRGRKQLKRERKRADTLDRS